MKQIYRLLVAVAFVLLGTVSAAAQTNDTVKHVVDRGETLASIAKRYSVTEAKIIELNPDAAQFVYVGMELVIPVSKTVGSPDNSTQNPTQFSARTSAGTVSNTVSTTAVPYNAGEVEDFKKWDIVGRIGYGFLPKVEGASSSGNGVMTFNLGANYNFSKSFYLGAKIGYTGSFTSAYWREGNISIDTDNDFISIPIETGYRIYFGDTKFALVPYAGLDFNIVVKSTVETGVGSEKEKQSVDPKSRLGVNGRLGMKIGYNGYYLYGSYVFSFDDNFGDNSGYPEVGIAFDIPIGI